MKKWLVAIAFSVLLLVPIGLQQVFGNHPQTPGCPSPGALIQHPSIESDLSSLGLPFCVHFEGDQAPECESPYIFGTMTIHFPDAVDADLGACIAATIQTPDPTHPDQCQDGAVLLSNHCVPDPNQQQVMCGEKTIQVGNLCFPDVFKVCGANTIPDEDVYMCFAQTMGMVGGILLDIDTMALLVANIGVNPILTGLVAITIAGVVGQAIWFVHRRKKKIE